MNKFMNKSVLASLCLVVLIALLPGCGCNKSGCAGGVCPVAQQTEEMKEVDVTKSQVEMMPDMNNMPADASAMPMAQMPEEASMKTDKF